MTTPRSVIAHQVRRAMGSDGTYVLVLHSGRVVPGPVVSCEIDAELDAQLRAKRLEGDRSTLACTTEAGVRVLLDDVARVEYQ